MEASVQRRTLGWFEASMILINIIMGTGIFTVPAYVFEGCGSVGLFLITWPLGALYAVFGYLCWLELGLGIPKSGGEKNYLDHMFPRPKFLMSTIYMILICFLYTSAPNVVAFGRYFLLAASGRDEDGYLSRGIGAIMLTFVIALHSLYPKFGRFLMKWVGLIKIFVIFTMIILGFLSLVKVIKPPGDPLKNFKQGFNKVTIPGTDEPVYQASPKTVALSLSHVIFAFSGWNSVNAVLGEIKNPIRNMKIAGAVAITTVSVVYLLVNIALLAVIPSERFGEAGLLISGEFFERATGKQWAGRIGAAFIALSNFGNVLAFTFVMARMIQEFAHSNMLCFSKFFSKNLNSSGSPLPAYLFHYGASVVVTMATPPGAAYSFVVNLPTYAILIMTGMVAVGLLWMQLFPSRSNWSSPFRCPTWVVVLFLAYVAYLLVASWLPSGGEGGGLPWWLSQVCGMAAMALGILWWAWAWKALPAITGKERIVPDRDLKAEDEGLKVEADDTV